MENTNIILFLILITIFVLGVFIIAFLTEISEYLKIISKDEEEKKVKQSNYAKYIITWGFFILVTIIVLAGILNLFFPFFK